MATTSSTSNRGTIGSSRDAVTGSQGRRAGNYSSANSQNYKGRSGPGKWVVYRLIHWFGGASFPTLGIKLNLIILYKLVGQKARTLHYMD